VDGGDAVLKTVPRNFCALPVKNKKLIGTLRARAPAAFRRRIAETLIAVNEKLLHAHSRPKNNYIREKRWASLREEPLDRRGVVRFQLQVPVILQWIGFSGAKRESAGQTRDISIFGAFVSCDVTPPGGTLVCLEVHLPPLERNTHQILRLKASGEVVRTAEHGQGIGIAISGRFSLHEVVSASSLASLS